MRASVRNAWLHFNEDLEGRVGFMYCDVKGLVSTGVGNLIDATRQPLTAPTPQERADSLAMARRFNWIHRPPAGDGNPASGAEVDAAWDAVKARMDLAPQGHRAYEALTTLGVTNDEINRFVFVKLDEMEATLRRQADFADFDNWPADAQMALLSMSWGMGPAFGFPNFRAFARAGDFEGCARECRFNPEQGTIIKRNDRDQLCFRNAAQVVAGGLDRERLFWPNSPATAPPPTTPPPTTPPPTTPPPTTPPPTTPPPTTPPTTPPPTTPPPTTPPPTTPPPTTPPPTSAPTPTPTPTPTPGL
jgi:hypothetical protein